MPWTKSDSLASKYYWNFKPPSIDEKTVVFQDQQSYQCWHNISDSTMAIHSMLISVQMTKEHKPSLLCFAFLAIWILQMSITTLVAYVGPEQIPKRFWRYFKIQRCKKKKKEKKVFSNSETFFTQNRHFRIRCALLERLLKPWAITSYLKASLFFFKIY